MSYTEKRRKTKKCVTLLIKIRTKTQIILMLIYLPEWWTAQHNVETIFRIANKFNILSLTKLIRNRDLDINQITCLKHFYWLWYLFYPLILLHQHIDGNALHIVAIQWCVFVWYSCVIWVWHSAEWATVRPSGFYCQLVLKHRL